MLSAAQCVGTLAPQSNNALQLTSAAQALRHSQPNAVFA
jgi:hypothetical protein